MVSVEAYSCSNNFYKNRICLNVKQLGRLKMNQGVREGVYQRLEENPAAMKNLIKRKLIYFHFYIDFALYMREY